MFALAFFLGVYSYTIFALGICNILFPPLVNITTVVFVGGFIFLIRKRLQRFFRTFVLPRNLLFLALLFLVVVQVCINLIGALGPELGFDALWYHGTLPKIYLFHHQVFHIKETLFYYSDMPKLIEMVYMGALSLGGDVLPKLVHFFLGIASCFVLYFFSRKFFSKTLSIATVVIFYANLVVGWESISGYIDLGRTFFEILALWAFVNWTENKKTKMLGLSACMTGLAITSKVLAFGTLGIFLALIFFFHFLKRYPTKKMLRDLGIYTLISIAIPLPWMVFSFIHTGSPFYPFFTPNYPTSLSLNLLNPFHFFSELWVLFTSSADPISPVYLAFLPLVVLYFKKTSFSLRLVSTYAFLSLFVWYITPRTGGGRFILPYLPAFSLLIVFPMQYAKKLLRNVLIGFVIIVSIISIGYRATANAKFVPVLLGKETTSEFLTTHLNFSFGDFYDTDNFFKTHMHSNDLVLVIGFHNLYYADFPFTLSSEDNHITYVAIQGNSVIPNTFQSWKLIHTNSLTHVRVYKK